MIDRASAAINKAISKYIFGIIFLALALVFGAQGALAYTAYDRVAVYSSTTGTGTITLGSVYCSGPSICPYQTFSGAGVTNSSTVRYMIVDGNAWESGAGVYTATGPTLTRGAETSSNGGSAITLDGNEIIFLTQTALDFNGYPSITGTPTSGHCVEWSSATVIEDSGATCGSGGSTAFSALTGSTNTTAAMVVGTGASLGVSGSGTITATAAPVSGLTGAGTGVVTALGNAVNTSGGVALLQPNDIRYYGATTAASDNTTAINNAIAYCVTNLCRVYIPPGTWNVTGTVTTGSADVQEAGFGFDDHGIINETSNNIVAVSFGNGSGSEGIQAADFGDMVIQYANVQTSSDTNSYCMQINFGAAANSLYNSRFGTVQCINAYRGIGQAATNPGAFWGNRTIVMQCKNNAGACIDIGNNGAGGNDPNNYWGNVYIDPQSTCADNYEINISYMSNTQFDNIEVNNTNCGIFLDPGSNRGVHIRNIRSEVVTLGSGMAGLGLIQCNGGECDVDGIEIQSITINVGAGQNAFIFQDKAGTSGWPTDHIKNVILTSEPTITSGALWGYDSPNVGMVVTPVVPYAGSTGYSGDIFTGDGTDLNVAYDFVTQAGTAGSLGTMSSASAFTAVTLSPTYGGTGENNGAHTLTLAGSLVTTGTATTTLALGNSNFTYTLPGSTSTLPGISGTPTTGHCVEWESAVLIEDSGAACGGGGSPGGSNTDVQYNNSSAFGGVAGFTFDGTSVITLGVAGTSVGGVKLANATSGTVELEPTTGALGTVAATFPANSGTVAEINLSQTFTNTQTFSGTANVSGTFELGGNALATGGALTFANLTVTNDLLYVSSSGNVGEEAVSSLGIGGSQITVTDTTHTSSANVANAGGQDNYNGSSITATGLGSPVGGSTQFITNQASTALTIANNSVTVGGLASSTTLDSYGFYGYTYNGTTNQWDAYGFPGYGTITSGALMKFNDATGAATAGNLSGDCTTTNTLAITCTKINGEAVTLAGPLTTTGTATTTLAFGNTNYTYTFPDVTATLPAISGTPTSGHCVEWASATQIEDDGSACGGSGSTPGGSNSDVQFNSSSTFGGVAGFTFDGTSVVTLGVAGTSVGGVKFANATSGTIELVPPTGALGTVSLTLNDHAGVLPVISGTPTTGDCVEWASVSQIEDAGAACGSGGGSTPVIPGGRITDNTSSCSHVTDSATITTLYYLPCISGYLPISTNGSTFTNETIPSTSTSLSTANATNFPANTIFDFYATIESSNVTYCAVAWGTSTAGSSSRGGSAGITQLLGITVNSGTWTCLNGATSYTLVANEATLLGTFFISGTAEDIAVNFAPAAASGGAACAIGYGNLYNTQSATCISRDDKSSWTYNAASWTTLDSSTTNQAAWIDPLGAYPYYAALDCTVKPNAAIGTNVAACAIGVNSTSTPSGVMGGNGAVDPVSVNANAMGTSPQSAGGLNYVQGLQQANTTSASTWYGTGLTNTTQAEGLFLNTLY